MVIKRGAICQRLWSGSDAMTVIQQREISGLNWRRPLECCGFDAAFPALHFASGASNLNVSLAESKAGKAASNPQHSKGFADPERSR